MPQSVNYARYLAGYAVLMAFDGTFSVYLRAVRSQFIPQAHLGKIMGLIGLMNMCSVLASGALISLLSGHFMPLQIITLILVTALILGLALIVYGRCAYGYRSWLPPVITADSPG